MKFSVKGQVKSITYDEKVKLSNDVKEIGPGKLGEIVGLIKANCPEAYKDLGDDNCQILVDNIDRTVMEMINARLTDILSTKRVKVK